MMNEVIPVRAPVHLKHEGAALPPSFILPPSAFTL
jgi:hypothetical protein